nr:hypothetical protein [Citrobacter portucalensis]
MLEDLSKFIIQLIFSTPRYCAHTRSTRNTTSSNKLPGII